MKSYRVAWANDPSAFEGPDYNNHAPIQDAAGAIRMILELEGFNRARIYGNGVLELTGPEGVEPVKQSSADAEQAASDTPAGESDEPETVGEKLDLAGRVNVLERSVDVLAELTSPKGSLGRRVIAADEGLDAHAKAHDHFVRALADLTLKVNQLQKDSANALVCYTALEQRLSGLESAVNMLCEGLVKAGILKRVTRHPADFYNSLREALRSVTAIHVRSKKGRDIVPGSAAAVDLWNRVWQFRDGLNNEAPDSLDVISVADTVEEWLDTLDAWTVELRDGGGDANTTDFIVQLARDIRSASRSLKVAPDNAMWFMLDRINATGQGEDYWQNRTLADRIGYAIEYVEGCDLDDDDTVSDWIRESPYASELLAALERCGLTKRVKMSKLLRHLSGKSMGNNSLTYRLKAWAVAGGPDEFRMDESVAVHLQDKGLPAYVRNDLNVALQRVSLDSSATLDEVVEELAS